MWPLYPNTEASDKYCAIYLGVSAILDRIALYDYWVQPSSGAEGPKMDEDKFNISVRKFLKVVGVTAQREIERAVREALNAGRLRGGEILKAKVTLEIEALGLTHLVEGDIELD
jgi:hypothetical protein